MILDDIEEPQDITAEDETPADETPDEKDIEESQDQDDDDDEIVVTIGDEDIKDDDDQLPEDARPWVKKLRKRFKDKDKEVKKLRQQIYEITSSQREQPPLPADDPGPMPTIEQSDYDNEQHAKKIADWQKRYESFVKKKTETNLVKQRQDEAWQEKMRQYNHKKNSLKVRDYEDAELTVQDTLSITQQGLIVQGADNPALVVYALGKNPKMAAEFSAVADPITFAFKVAKLETQLKTSKKKARTKPETPLKTTGKLSGAMDSKLDRLRADAEKTGDYSEVNRVKRELRRKRKAG